mmetsp:Transcript_121286/g.387569  ORF Transcript_121286/g.387569 Transcript_121286/m.387569 type:complete len:1148 (+) Transcript_121286:146-3589(+)
MDGFFRGIEMALERLSRMGFAACQGGPKKDHSHQETLHLFVIRPLKSSSPEADRAIQEAIGLLDEGRHEEALRAVHDARHRAPHSREVLHSLGSVCYIMGDEPSALRWFHEAHRMAPFDDNIVLAFAVLEQRRQHFELAQQLLTRFLREVDAAHVGVTRQLARVYQESGDWSKAAGCFHRLLAIDPKGAEWAAELQRCLDRLPTKDGYGEPLPDPLGLPGDFAHVFSDRDPGAGASNKGRSASSMRHMAEAKALRTGAPTGAATAAAWEQLREASQFQRAGRIEAAMDVYEGLLRHAGEHAMEAKALSGLVECKHELGDLEGALESAQQLLRIQPDHPEANLRVAELLLEAGHGADMTDPYLSRAAEATGQGRLGGALPGTEDGDAGRTLQIRVLCARAEAALAREDHTQALKAAAEAVRRDVALPRALVLLGSARLRIAEYAGALRVLGTARDSLGPTAAASSHRSFARRQLAETHVLMAQAHERLRQYPQALAQAQRALEQEPSLAAARVARAMALQQSGQAREAELELWEALQQDPQSAAARLQLGYCQLCNGDAAQAVGTLEVLDSGLGILRSQLGAAKAYMALALDSPVALGALPQPHVLHRAEDAIRECLVLHQNLRHVWSEIESGPVSNPVEAVQRLRGICDLDLTSMQAKQLLRLMSRSSGRTDLIQVMASLAVPQQQQLQQQQQQQHQQQQGRGRGGHHGGSASRQSSAPPPNRWATGSYDVGLRGVAGSGVSTPTGDARGSMFRGSSAARGEAPSRGSWAIQSHGTSQPSTRAETPYGGTPHRGRSMSPGAASGKVGGGWSGYPGPSGGGGLGGGGGGGYRSRPSGSRDDASSVPRGGGGGGATGSRDQSPSGRSGAGESLSIGWNELITPEQLIFGPQLGSGGSATVFRGSWHGQEVAIKKISGVAHMEEMKKEINALRRLRHPRLVRFIGACLQPPQLLVVTEFMSGGSLHDRIFGVRREGLGPSQLWVIAAQVAEGLDFLHTQRVVHRDLKSMNILLDAMSSAKICDFGLAQQMDMSATHIDRKVDGEGGSPRYMAPECFDAANGKITEKVDIWAMGCILIELFAGVLPYADCTNMPQLTARILIERRPPELPPRVSPQVAGLIRRCVAYQPTARPSAGELRAELARLAPQRAR